MYVYYTYAYVYLYVDGVSIQTADCAPQRRRVDLYTYP